MKPTRYFFRSVLVLVLAAFLTGCAGVNIPSWEDQRSVPPSVSGGTLSGFINNRANGRPMAGSTVSLNGGQHTVLTGPNGSYRFTSLPTGIHQLSVSATGFFSFQTSIRIRQNRETRLNIRLRPDGTTTLNPTPSPIPTLTPIPSPIPSPSLTPTPSIGGITQANLDLVRRFGWGGNNVARWPNGTVGVHDSTNASWMPNILNRWNEVIAGPTTFIISNDATSPVTIIYDEGVRNFGHGVWGVCTVWVRNWAIYRARVSILPPGNWYGWHMTPTESLYMHELGHVVGFGGHTSDGGVMDAIANGSTTITSTVHRMLNTLYQLPIGHPLARHSNVPRDGVFTIPLKNPFQ
ncbi:MAG TPA: carboxypeptidase-like regulatory domain-containing protein [Atribacteraceae bacterium]|nr:carboxypeptidase-like regulatory domain-containing protein [Atribacteraceae bacterium]